MGKRKIEFKRNQSENDIIHRTEFKLSLNILKYPHANIQFNIYIYTTDILYNNFNIKTITKNSV